MTIVRVHYREGQILRAADLADEQAVRVSLRRLHNIAQHGWGIVAGLALKADGNGLHVSAGMAVDGYGRELIVPQPVFVPWRGPLSRDEQDNASPPDLFDRLMRDAIDVWLIYAESPAALMQTGRSACGVG
jgi:hypothetical protein